MSEHVIKRGRADEKGKFANQTLDKTSREKVEEEEEEEEKELEEVDHGVLMYDVLKIIFKHLLAKDLCSAAIVCRLWQDVATNEMEKRSMVIKMAPWRESFKQCFSENHFHNNLTAKPMLGFLFNSSENGPPPCLRKHLPRTCMAMTINNNGLVLNNTELERGDGNVLMTFLPEHPDVNIEYMVTMSDKVVHLNKEMTILNETRMQTTHHLRNAEPFFREAFERLKDLKCTILLTSERFRHDALLCQMNSFKKNVRVLWGGAARSLVLNRQEITGKPRNTTVLWTVIMISGKNVRSWSTVIRKNVKRKAEIEEKLIEMRKSVQPLRHIVGFMYACVGRGEGFHCEKNVESSIFKKVFPDIPLVGCFGGGEYGTTTVGNNQDTDRKNHQYSTVFMILTYG